MNAREITNILVKLEEVIRDLKILKDNIDDQREISSNIEVDPIGGKEFLTIKDFCNKYSSIITEGSLRWILFNSKFNGADCFIRKIGKRRLLISPKLFFSWIESNKRGIVK